MTGVLKGFDQLLNLVLDDVEEQVQGPYSTLSLPLSVSPVHPPFADPEPRIRSLGLAVLRGPTITLLSPVDGLEEISNPFLSQE